MRDRLQRAGAGLREALFPPLCLLCHAPVGGVGLCAPCHRAAPFLRGAACRGCAAPLPGHDDGPARCDDCLRAPRPWDDARAALRYDGAGRRLVLELKHADRTELAQAAALWLHRAARGAVSRETLLVPVPLHPWRLLRRRYNQSAEIARALAPLAGAAFRPLALRRTRATLPQDHRSRPDRQRNVAGSIALAEDVRGRHVAVVDDVMASGATMAACADALRAGGAARVTALVLARVARGA